MCWVVDAVVSIDGNGVGACECNKWCKRKVRRVWS